MRKLMTAGVVALLPVCVLGIVFTGGAPAYAQQERIRIIDVRVSEPVFNTRSEEPLTITGTVFEICGEQEIPAPQLTATIEGKLDVPVALTDPIVEHISSEPLMIMTDWKFSLVWDGTVPWDLFPQGRFVCEITAVSRRNPQLRSIHKEYFEVRSE